MPLVDYFTDDAIITHLCKARMKHAESRNNRQYAPRLIGDMHEQPPQGLLYRVLPSRRTVTRFRPKFRTGINPDLLALNYATRRLRHEPAHQHWSSELNQFIAGVRSRVLGDQPFFLTTPRIAWQLKAGHDYRALARFTLEDNLILCLYSRFSRDSLDPQFSDSSFAFRARRAGRTPTHHDCVNLIYELRHSYPGQDLYVAECDIRGFYDTVDHDIALNAYHEAARRAGLDARSEQIFRAYLNCYSFPQTVLVQARPRLRRYDREGDFPWPLDALQSYHSDPMAARIGIPQGGAVSGTIANLILDYADKQVEEKAQRLGARIHYYRFCDDMVLISPRKDWCQRVFNAYLQELDRLRLPFHKPERTLIYGKDHWEHKSKAPYRWSGQHWFGCVPWLQFVGYQIRRDGLIRPKPSSVKKEIKKLIKKTDVLKFALIRASEHSPVLATAAQAIRSLKHKLVAQGVGRIRGGEATGPKPMCWAAGFKALHNKPLVTKSLRLLDRTRRKQLSRFAGARIGYGPGRRNRGGDRRDPIGYGFSYHAQYTNLGGRELIDNPWRPHNLKDRIKYCGFLAARAAYNNTTITYSRCLIIPNGGWVG